MNLKHKLFLTIILGLLIVPTVLGNEGHIKLLAVSENNGYYAGRIADLYLEIIDGRGRVFLETFPLTKFDTQISTRIAKQISCDFLDTDCLNYDFIYTIKSNTGIIGGPSAGGAVSVLTTAMLKGLKIKDDVAMTGTINPGGLIGPVSGIKEKIEAASQNGITKVLIPKGTRYANKEEIKSILPLNMKNDTVDLVEYGSLLGLEIVEVSTIAEALEHATGVNIEVQDKPLIINTDYQNTMKYLSEKLCTRSKGLIESLESIELNQELFDEKDRAVNLLDLSHNETVQELHYSAASRCFNANIILSTIKKQNENLSKDIIIEHAKILEQMINTSSQEFSEKPLNTIMDLQAYMVVRERLYESLDTVKEVKITGSASDYVYAVERYESAVAWSEFFDKPGRVYNIQEETLKDSCLKKINEADERVQYVQYFFPEISDPLTESLKIAKDYSENQEYVLCLFKASKTKAEADSYYSLIGININQLNETINTKLIIAKNAIVKESSKGSFPILAYSYYEYAQQLKDENVYTALLYTQYALELSNLRGYFNEQPSIFTLVTRYDYKAFMLTIGLFIGLMIGYFIGSSKKL